MAIKSYVDQKTDLMNQLLWTNILRQWVATELVALPAGIPVVGPAISAVFAFPPVQNIILYFLDKEVVWKLFYMLTRWGVFTSVDWKEDAIYNAYETKAVALLKNAPDPNAPWTPKQDKDFTDAADDLMELHVPGWNS